MTDIDYIYWCFACDSDFQGFADEAECPFCGSPNVELEETDYAGWTPPTTTTAAGDTPAAA